MKLKSSLFAVSLVAAVFCGPGLRAAPAAADAVLDQVRLSNAITADLFVQLEARVQSKGFTLAPYHFMSTRPLPKTNPGQLTPGFHFELSLNYRRPIKGPFGNRPGGNGFHVVVLTLKGSFQKDSNGTPTAVQLRYFDVYDAIKPPNIPHGDSSSGGYR